MFPFLKKPIELFWIYLKPDGKLPNDHLTPAGALQVEVRRIRKTPAGFLGWRKSPSNIHCFHDMELKCTVRDGNRFKKNQTVLLFLPNENLPDRIRAGDTIILDMVDEQLSERNRVTHCVSRISKITNPTTS